MYLHMKRPAIHIFVKIPQVWIIINALKGRLPAIMFCEFRGECGFSAANVTANCNMTEFGCLHLYRRTTVAYYSQFFLLKYHRNNMEEAIIKTTANGYPPIQLSSGI